MREQKHLNLTAAQETARRLGLLGSITAELRATVQALHEAYAANEVSDLAFAAIHTKVRRLMRTGMEEEDVAALQGIVAEAKVMHHELLSDVEMKVLSRNRRGTQHRDWGTP